MKYIISELIIQKNKISIVGIVVIEKESHWICFTMKCFFLSGNILLMKNMFCDIFAIFMAFLVFSASFITSTHIILLRLVFYGLWRP